MNSQQKIIVFATKGENTNDELRILSLLDGFKVDIFAFDYRKKILSFWLLIKTP